MKRIKMTPKEHQELVRKRTYDSILSFLYKERREVDRKITRLTIKRERERVKQND